MNGPRVVQINVSPGGVPKLPVDAARITRAGVEGDRQREITVHGGPHRAVSILGIEAIDRVAAEGHPIGPGTTGENLTTEGFDVSALPVGTRLEVGDEVVLELSGPANPCRTIRHSFRDLRFGRLSQATHPADSRMYARVIREGTARAGDPVTVRPPADDAAERHVVANRLERAGRSSSVALWQAAVASGAPVAILDDGEIAAAAAPALPGPIFNLALGFAHLPNLVPMAVDHLRSNGATGWIWLEDEPWPDAIVDSTAVLVGAELAELPEVRAAADGVTVRELARDEVGPWAAVIASDLPDPLASAWQALEAPLARFAHQHHFLAERDGKPVGAAALYTQHRVGWLRSATVLREARGLGIQRALLAARIEKARRLGCDLVGSLADAGSVSAVNLERVGLRPVAVRRRYRVETSAGSAERERASA